MPQCESGAAALFFWDVRDLITQMLSSLASMRTRRMPTPHQSRVASMRDMLRAVRTGIIAYRSGARTVLSTPSCFALLYSRRSARRPRLAAILCVVVDEGALCDLLTWRVTPRLSPCPPFDLARCMPSANLFRYSSIAVFVTSVSRPVSLFLTVHDAAVPDEVPVAADVEFDSASHCCC